MKHLTIGALALLLGAAAPAPRPMAALGWMAGQWATADGGTEEAWLAPRGGVMLGLGRTVANGVAREFEFLRLQAGEDGVPVYWASPNGVPAVRFRLTESGPADATFDNPDHDYPQRIHYRRDGDRMVATISALDGSHAMSWTYRLR
jgi:hypothetical protein